MLAREGPVLWQAWLGCCTRPLPLHACLIPRGGPASLGVKQPAPRPPTLLTATHASPAPTPLPLRCRRGVRRVHAILAGAGLLCRALLAALRQREALPPHLPANRVRLTACGER